MLPGSTRPTNELPHAHTRKPKTPQKACPKNSVTRTLGAPKLLQNAEPQIKKTFVFLCFLARAPAKC